MYRARANAPRCCCCYFFVPVIRARGFISRRNTEGEAVVVVLLRIDDESFFLAPRACTASLSLSLSFFEATLLYDERDGIMVPSRAGCILLLARKNI